MAKNTTSAAFSGVKSSFNLMKEWQASKAAQEAYFHQANSLLNENEAEIRKMKRENEEERGKNVSKAGASGIDVSSFNDAVLSEDLKNDRDIYDKQVQTQAKASALRNKAYAERRKRWKKSLSLSADLLSDWSGLLSWRGGENEQR